MSIRANIIKGEHKMAAKFYAKSPGNEGVYQKYGGYRAS